MSPMTQTNAGAGHAPGNIARNIQARGGRLRHAPGETPTTWRERRIEWLSGSASTVIAALPAIEARPVTNAAGAAHRHSAFIACRWPPGGGLTTRERTAWNGRPTGTGPAWPPPVQPAIAARAFHHFIQAITGTGPQRPWRIGIAEHSEWYTVSVPLSAPFDLGGRRAERWVSMEHATHWAQITCHAGVRDRLSGAMICAHQTPASIESGRLADPIGVLGVTAFGRRLAEDAIEIERSLRAWVRTVPGPEILRTWADAYVTPGWGKATADDAVCADAESGDVTAADAAWRLAEACLAIPSIEERMFHTQHAMDVVDELASAQAARPDTGHNTVH